MKRRIVPIVEGRSEADSIPAFLRRLFGDLGVHDVEPDQVIREHRNRLVKPEVFSRRVEMATRRPNCSGVLVLFDADDDAACLLGPRLLEQARGPCGHMPSRVVLAVREIEAWLLAGMDSLRGCRGIRDDAEPPPEVESIRGAKERLGQFMTSGYKSTIDQLPLLLRLDYHIARRRAPSLDKFIRDVQSLVERIA